MTVTVKPIFNQYTANGIASSFPFLFYLLDVAHLQVWVNGVLTTSGFTVAGVGNQNGGSVNFTVPPAQDTIVLLIRDVPADQEVDLVPYDPFPAETIEQSLDKLTMLAQQLAEGLAQSINTPLSEVSITFNMVLPSVGVRSNQILGFDQFGNVTVYPQTGGGGGGVTAHDALTGLTVGNDHPQYLLGVDAQSGYLQKAGGTMTGALLLTGTPAQPQQAATKQYVDNFTGSVATQNVISNALGDAQTTVEAGWNAQANASAIFRAANAIIYYTWKSTGGLVYRYVGSQQGPAGWASQPDDWVQSAGVTDAPADGQAYARKNFTWVTAIEKSGGTLTGQLTLPGGGTGLQAIAVQEAAALDTSSLSGHVAAGDPHAVYILKTQKAAANGVASLDAGIKIPVAQIPTAVANGVASLDANVKVPQAQLDSTRVWTLPQRSTPVAANTGSFDMALSNDFTCTTAGATQISFANVAAGQRGMISLVNGGNHAITFAAPVVHGADAAVDLSVTGSYLLAYWSADGVNTFLTYSEALA